MLNFHRIPFSTDPSEALPLVTFPQFVEFLVEEPAAIFADKHWRPQWLTCDPCAEIYHFQGEFGERATVWPYRFMKNRHEMIVLHECIGCNAAF